MNDRLYGIVKSATKIVREIEFLSQFKLSQVWPVPINFKSISKMRLTKTRLSNPLKTAVHRNTNEKTGLNQILKTKVECLLILPSNKRTQVRTRAKFGKHDTLPSRTTFDSMGRQLRQILPMIIKFTKRKEKKREQGNRIVTGKYFDFKLQLSIEKRCWWKKIRTVEK